MTRYLLAFEDGLYESIEHAAESLTVIDTKTGEVVDFEIDTRAVTKIYITNVVYSSKGIMKDNKTPVAKIVSEEYDDNIVGRKNWGYRIVSAQATYAKDI